MANIKLKYHPRITILMSFNIFVAVLLLVLFAEPLQAAKLYNVDEFELDGVCFRHTPDEARLLFSERYSFNPEDTIKRIHRDPHPITGQANAELNLFISQKILESGCISMQAWKIGILDT